MLDRLDQVAGFQLRVVERVATDEGGAFEDRVVELACLRPVRPRRADERAGLEPFAAQNRIARGRDRHDDVLGRRFTVALGRLGADLAAEGVQPLLVTAVGNDLLDRRHRLPDARNLRARLRPAADHPQRADAGPRKVLRRDGLHLPALEEHDHEGHALTGRDVGLHAGEAPATVDGRHDGKRAAVEPDAVARHVFDLAGGEPAERVLARCDRIGRGKQPRNVGL